MYNKFIPSKTKIVFTVLCIEQQDLHFQPVSILPVAEGRMKQKDNLLRTMEEESVLLLSGDEVDKGQTSE